MSSESEDEDYVSFGTPLDPIDEDAVSSKKFQRVEDQIATDEQGRRRFHGAFTGGYSAGFFNTVGSLEGWTPSSFKSSKKEKAAYQTRRPEDFMDDEDTSEFGIAPQALRVKGTFSDNNTTKRKLPQYHSGPIPGVPVLSEILKPVQETIGIKLLKSMGWKPGQGIGPRVTKTEKMKMKKQLKKSMANKKVYGCAIGPPAPSDSQQNSSESNESSDDDEFRKVLLAPLEFEQFVVKPKTNLFGIGYSGLDRQPVLSSKHYNLFDQPSGVNLTEKQKKVSIRGHAFGVGAFEKDDEDIYAQEDLSQYDFSLPCPTASKTVKTQASLAITHESEIIDGFVEATKFILKKKFFPPPNLPSGWQPSGIGSVTVSELVENKPVSTSKDRAALLGEVSRWSSVDEGKKDSTTSKSETAEPAKKLHQVEEVPSSIRFKPFASDISKQKRYEQYQLFVKLGEKGRLNSIQPSSMTEWEKEHERIEFEGAFRLYKPLSEDIADRFTSAQQADDALNPLIPVARTIDPTMKEMEDAAKMKMFGKLTRKVTSWHPDSLVFKRFNIAETSEKGSLESALEKKRSRPKFSLFNFTDIPPACSSHQIISTENFIEDIKPNITISSSESESKEIYLPNPSVSTGDSILLDNQSALELSIEERLKMFRDIFLDSSEDEDTQEVSTNEKSYESINASNEEIPSLEKEDTSRTNIVRNTAPAKGIFANLDLERLAMPVQIESDSVDDESSSSKSSDNEEEKSSFYGPQLPSRSTSDNTHSRAKISVKSLIEKSSVKKDKGKWIEEKSKKGKHKKQKKEHKKRKSKHKKKKHRK